MGFIETLQQSESGSALITFLLSMTPVIELRGSIPVGVGLGLSHMSAMLISIVGNMVPVPFIILFIRKIFEVMSRHSEVLAKLVKKLEVRAEGKWDKVHKLQFLGLMVLVAIPLPGTGAWTGSLVAAIMDMRLRSALPSIALGVVIAGILVTGLTYGFTEILT